MRKLMIICSILFFNEKAFSLNIYELTAIGMAIPLLYDQYFDDSLNEENIYQKSNKVINKHNLKRMTSDLNPIINSNSDLIYYLEIIEEMDLYKKSY
tara:strand:- start:247 stop:537 length:291 start_codon:yes stop_codon:yes gene_type:complete